MVDARRIDLIHRSLEEGDPHIGAENEGIMSNRETLEVVHNIKGLQPTQAVKGWLGQNLEKGSDQVIPYICPDIPETTVEANPPPLHSPKSSAAAQRLIAILIDAACEGLSTQEQHLQLTHGATLRPPNIKAADASSEAEAFKRIYYEYQIGVHHDKVGAAAGDHLNFSIPWLNQLGEREISKKLIEMTARMRLIAGALSIGLSAASPLYSGSNGEKHEPTHMTALTPWESTRLGRVWPGRTIMDVSTLYKDLVSFKETMELFAKNGTLKSGRDVWLMVRAQPGHIEKGRSFTDLCSELKIDLNDEEDKIRAKKLLLASFQFGPHHAENPLKNDAQWKSVEAWRQEMLTRLIQAPRSRVEIRTLETPPAFEENEDGRAVTPYEYIKGLQTFLELLFIYISENPDFTESLSYGEMELQAAKANETEVLKRGLDATIQWIPRNMRSMKMGELLQGLLKNIDALANALDRSEDIQIIREIGNETLRTPATRIRQEVGRWYDINVERTHDSSRILKDDSYPRHLLERTRKAMPLELAQIEKDLPSMPILDQPYIQTLLTLAKKLKIK